MPRTRLCQTLAQDQYPRCQVVLAAVRAYQYNHGRWIHQRWNEHHWPTNLEIVRNSLDRALDYSPAAHALAQHVTQYFRSLTWHIIAGSQLDNCLRRAHTLCMQDNIALAQLEFASRLPHLYGFYNTQSTAQNLLDTVLHQC